MGTSEPATGNDRVSRPAIFQDPSAKTSYVGMGLFAASLLAGFAFTRNSKGLPLDDAYIHLVFARNLGSGQGFSFNPAEFSLGFSSPLWVMLMAAMQWLSADLVSASRNLSIIFSAGSAALLYMIVRSSIANGEKRRMNEALAILSALVFIASGNMLWLAAAGMEASLYLFLGLLAILLLQSEYPRPVLGGIALGLALLTRAEALSLWIFLAMQGLLYFKRGARFQVPCIMAVALAAPWCVFSYLKTGWALPATAAGKIASDLFNSGFSIKGISIFIFRHLVYLARFDQGIALLLAAALLAAVSLVLVLKRGASRAGRPASASLFLSPAAALMAWAILNLGGHALIFRSTAIITPYNNLRYQPMLIPAIIAAAVLALSRLDQASPRRRAISLLAMILPAAALLMEMGGIGEWRTLYSRQVDQLQKEHRASAEWARAELPPNARIAALDIGLLGFYSNRYVIDLGGLIDPAIRKDLRAHRTGSYLVKRGATHYFHLVRHDSEKITGVKKDDGVLYRLRLLESFNYPSFPEPVFLHSFGIEACEVMPLPGN